MLMQNPFFPRPKFPKNPLSRIIRGIVGAFVNVIIKPIRNYIDNNFRPKVTPVAGSVVYCDLWRGAEHSGIYISDGKISNIVVTGFADSKVKLSDVNDFTSKSTFGNKIYVSSNKHGAVGDDAVAKRAESKVGEQSFYGLVFKNCHEFCRNCLTPPKTNHNFLEKELADIEETYDDLTLISTDVEKTIRLLKAESRKKLGATKWLLWDLDTLDKNNPKTKHSEPEPEPDWQAQEDFLKNQPLTPEFIEILRQELQDMKDYLDEISDENIPPHVVKKLKNITDTMQKVSDKYEEMKDFLKSCPDARFSYRDFLDCQSKGMNFTNLAKQLQNNPKIKELAHKMGRAYVSEARQKRTKVPTRSKNEVHGTHYSDDVVRVLPSELINLDDENLEYLFYARLHEKTLTTYELDGISTDEKEILENHQKTTGSVVACLDTSASMQGEPLLKAKASLFAIANILKREKRDLYVLLFGDTGQIKEYRLESSDDLVGLLKFLQQGFDGGTDFESPLNRAIEIIGGQSNYLKADVLMLSDGDCTLSDIFIQKLNDKKSELDLMVYSVLCHGTRIEDKFSDEVLVL